MGASFKFVHCADLHLGSRFRGVSEDDPQRARMLTDTVSQSFSRIVDLAISEKADALLIAGDSFDEENITPRTRMFLVSELTRVRIPVFMVRGNHDPRTAYDDSMPMPSNVRIFGADPESVGIPGIDAAEVVGASFREWHEERNLPSMMRGSPGCFSIGLVHCDVDSAGSDYAYSPCSLSDLQGKGIDYWALGHIHKRSVLSEDPWAVYPGNIQGRSLKETGEKGAYVVTVTDGRVSEARFVPTQGIIWFDEEADITGKDLQSFLKDLKERVPGGSVLRLRVVGRGPLDDLMRSEDAVKLLSEQLGCTMAGLDVRSGPDIDIESRKRSGDMIGMVAKAADALVSEGRQAFLDIIASNPVAKAHMDLFEQMSDEEIRAIVDSAVETLAGKMEASR